MRHASGAEIRVRPARTEDRAQLIEICARAFPSSLRWVRGTALADRWWRTALDGTCSEAWVAEETGTGRLLGVMVLVLDEAAWKTTRQTRQPGPAERLAAVLRDPGRLWSLYWKGRRPARPADLPPASRHDPADRLFLELIAVLPEAQGRGIGRQLLDFCFERARALDRAGLACVVDSRNPAMHLYRKAGFGMTGESGQNLTLSVAVDPPPAVAVE